jgi:hypothetical protein
VASAATNEARVERSSSLRQCRCHRRFSVQADAQVMLMIQHEVFAYALVNVAVAGALLMISVSSANARPPIRRPEKEKQILKFLELQKNPLKYKKGSLKLNRPMHDQEQ